MKAEIIVDRGTRVAGMAITTDEGLQVEWHQLSDDDQDLLFNTLIQFADLFFKTMVKARGLEDQVSKNAKALLTTEDGDELDAEAKETIEPILQ